MLRTRVISAVVLLPIVVTCAWFGHPWFTFLVAVILGLGAYEFAHMGRRAGHDTVPLFSFLLAGALALEAGFSGGQYRSPVLSLAALAITIWYVFHAKTPTRSEAWSWTIACSVYVGYLGLHMISLRALPGGLAWLALAVVGVWISDSGAYAVGRLWGRRKMAPHLSPKKTWEGAVGGLISALLFTPILAWMGGISLVHGLACGFLVGGICPFGDLAISMVKRQVGVKDTSNLIPGHGGMLDRLDTLLFSAPLIFYYVTLVALR